MVMKTVGPGAGMDEKAGWRGTLGTLGIQY